MLYGTASTAGRRKSAHVESPTGRRQQRVQQLLRLGLNPPWQDVLRFLADEIDAWKQRPQFATLMVFDEDDFCCFAGVFDTQ